MRGAMRGYVLKPIKNAFVMVMERKLGILFSKKVRAMVYECL